ncbi:MAG TPA: NAD(P)-binding protein [Burkholderiaceae bacterium]|nr:NAD(P)-binding protein [Burkholderiaceae bacterium]
MMRVSAKDADASDIIVGGGIAGIVDALELAQNGRRVLLRDRDAEGIFAVDTPLQRRDGVRDRAANGVTAVATPNGGPYEPEHG